MATELTGSFYWDPVSRLGVLRPKPDPTRRKPRIRNSTQWKLHYSVILLKPCILIIVFILIWTVASIWYIYLILWFTYVPVKSTITYYWLYHTLVYPEFLLMLKYKKKHFGNLLICFPLFAISYYETKAVTKNLSYWNHYDNGILLFLFQSAYISKIQLKGMNQSGNNDISI